MGLELVSKPGVMSSSGVMYPYVSEKSYVSKNFYEFKKKIFSPLCDGFLKR